MSRELPLVPYLSLLMETEHFGQSVLHIKWMKFVKITIAVILRLKLLQLYIIIDERPDCEIHISIIKWEK